MTQKPHRTDTVVVQARSALTLWMKAFGEVQNQPSAHGRLLLTQRKDELDNAFLSLGNAFQQAFSPWLKPKTQVRFLFDDSHNIRFGVGNLPRNITLFTEPSDRQAQRLGMFDFLLGFLCAMSQHTPRKTVQEHKRLAGAGLVPQNSHQWLFRMPFWPGRSNQPFKTCLRSAQGQTVTDALFSAFLQETGERKECPGHPPPDILKIPHFETHVERKNLFPPDQAIEMGERFFITWHNQTTTSASLSKDLMIRIEQQAMAKRLREENGCAQYAHCDDSLWNGFFQEEPLLTELWKGIRRSPKKEIETKSFLVTMSQHRSQDPESRIVVRAKTAHEAAWIAVWMALEERSVPKTQPLRTDGWTVQRLDKEEKPIFLRRVSESEANLST